jgi:hypothetical protein
MHWNVLGVFFFMRTACARVAAMVREGVGLLLLGPLNWHSDENRLSGVFRPADPGAAEAAVGTDCRAGGDDHQP